MSGFPQNNPPQQQLQRGWLWLPEARAPLKTGSRLKGGQGQGHKDAKSSTKELRSAATQDHLIWTQIPKDPYPFLQSQSKIIGPELHEEADV